MFKKASEHDDTVHMCDIILICSHRMWRWRTDLFWSSVMCLSVSQNKFLTHADKLRCYFYISSFSQLFVRPCATHFETAISNYSGSLTEKVQIFSSLWKHFINMLLCLTPGKVLVSHKRCLCV